VAAYAFVGSLALRGLAILAGLGVTAWLAILALATWFVVISAASSGVLRGVAYEPAKAAVESFTREERTEGGFRRYTATLTYHYSFGGKPYEGKLESMGTSNLSPGDPLSTIGTAEAEAARYRRGDVLSIHVNPENPSISSISAPMTRTLWVLNAAQALALTAGAVFVPWLVYRLVARPLPAAEIPLPAPVEQLRRAYERFDQASATWPEGDDVAIPASVAEIREEPDSLQVEFAQARNVLGGLSGLAFMLAVMGLIAFNGGLAGHSVASLILFAAIALALAWMAYSALAGRTRRHSIEASDGSLTVCTGHGSSRKCRTFARNEIDFLEARPTEATGTDVRLEIAAILRDGRRVVIAGNLPGIAITDTLVRRIGRRVGLYPEQCLATIPAARRGSQPIRELLAMLGKSRR
jgi:hypothetical protein